MMSSLCNLLLLPFAFLYGAAVRLRNRLFDLGCIASVSYPVPVICVGNIAVGGTGKTPHTEYIIRLLKDAYRVAVLSRGYRRKTTGFVVADQRSTSRDIGDEPYQMKRKFPDIIVAVDEDRREGIRRLMSMPNGQQPEVILMDDAFQHRRVKPSLSIVLTDCHRLFCDDRLLPAGRLREPACGVRRADMVVVTKCPEGMTSAERRAIEERMHLMPHQRVFFSSMTYEEMKPVFPLYAEGIPGKDALAGSSIIALAGIASPEGFISEVRKMSERVMPLVFADHHAFGRKDIRRIEKVFEAMPAKSRYIIVTEKDAARLADSPLVPEEWKRCMYSLPITTAFIPGGKNFDDEIKNHIITFQKDKVSRDEQTN